MEKPGCLSQVNGEGGVNHSGTRVSLEEKEDD